MIDFRTYAENNGLETDQINTVISEVTDLMEQYVGFYRDRTDWKVLSAEEPFYMDIPSADVRIRATPDAVIEDRTGLYVVEHKSTSEIPPASWRGCDPQTALQYFLISRSKRFGELRGIRFNYLLTQIPKEPGVVGMKEKTGPRFAANSSMTTSVAFNRGWDKLELVWRGTFKEATEYRDEWYKKLVNDGAWFQRFDVYKPMGLVMETVKDVAEVVWAIRRAEETGIWRRSLHIVTCSRFCTYQSLCSEETLNGKPSQALREALFVVDDGRREGR